MKRKYAISGIRSKYLKYTLALLALALSCIGIWVYVRTSVTKSPRSVFCMKMYRRACSQAV